MCQVHARQAVPDHLAPGQVRTAIGRRARDLLGADPRIACAACDDRRTEAAAHALAAELADHDPIEVVRDLVRDDLWAPPGLSGSRFGPRVLSGRPGTWHPHPLATAAALLAQRGQPRQVPVLHPTAGRPRGLFRKHPTPAQVGTLTGWVVAGRRYDFGTVHYVVSTDGAVCEVRDLKAEYRDGEIHLGSGDDVAAFIARLSEALRSATTTGTDVVTDEAKGAALHALSMAGA